ILRRFACTGSILLALVLFLARTDPGRAQVVLDDGFEDTLVVGDLFSPVAVDFMPDGRMLIAHHSSGVVDVLQDGVLSPPLIDLKQYVPPGGSYDSYIERGLSSVVVDPAFTQNGLLYVFYTVCMLPASTDTCPEARTRVARFRMEGNVV